MGHLRKPTLHNHLWGEGYGEYASAAVSHLALEVEERAGVGSNRYPYASFVLRTLEWECNVSLSTAFDGVAEPPADD